MTIQRDWRFSKFWCILSLQTIIWSIPWLHKNPKKSRKENQRHQEASKPFALSNSKKTQNKTRIRWMFWQITSLITKNCLIKSSRRKNLEEQVSKIVITKQTINQWIKGEDQEKHSLRTMLLRALFNHVKRYFLPWRHKEWSWKKSRKRRTK